MQKRNTKLDIATVAYLQELANELESAVRASNDTRKRAAHKEARGVSPEQTIRDLAAGLREYVDEAAAAHQAALTAYYAKRASKKRAAQPQEEAASTAAEAPARPDMALDEELMESIWAT